ncbi:polysaccharide lyase family 1 protein [Cadophora sp. DSE1049]|nr:polysaccharide lyase family 1 protein [Cadophora sp. DSE1049]
MLLHTPFFVALALCCNNVAGQVVGSAKGMATGTTGGGSATPAVPSSLAQLKTWLTDSTARVIMIDRTWDFTGSEGTTSATGCAPWTCTNGYAPQKAINANGWCGSTTSASVSYDNAGPTPIDLGSNKSIVGVGTGGVIKGKGFRIRGGVSNVIIQNIHITNLNPSLVWGGDAIQITGASKIWIDHCKFSLIGRQMIVTGYEPATYLTVSNCIFDGTTSWSASCNNQHYWTVLLLGSDDKITFAYNHFYHDSGRAPKIGGAGGQHVQFVNNYFNTMGGHAFDISSGANVLIEGNYFNAVTTPMTSASSSYSGYLYTVSTSAAASACSSYLGRSCQTNALASSGSWPSYTSTAVLSWMQTYVNYLITPMASSSVVSYVTAHAGPGKS